MRLYVAWKFIRVVVMDLPNIDWCQMVVMCPVSVWTFSEKGHTPHLECVMRNNQSLAAMAAVQERMISDITAPGCNTQMEIRIHQQTLTTCTVRCKE